MFSCISLRRSKLVLVGSFLIGIVLFYGIVTEEQASPNGQRLKTGFAESLYVIKSKVGLEVKSNISRTFSPMSATHGQTITEVSGRVNSQSVPLKEIHISEPRDEDDKLPDKNSQPLDKNSQLPNHEDSQTPDKDIHRSDKDSQEPKVSVQYKVKDDQLGKDNVALPSKPKVDRFSALPINSTLAMPLIKGTEYLDISVRRKYLRCRAMISRDTRVAYGKCRNFTNMHFIDGSRLVAMPSFPGSGSTWARTALEQATGIYTGSIYCDKKLKSKGFAGELVVSANVLTVKTHLPSRELFPRAKEFRDPNKYKDITAVILLVRNPLDSFVSKWNFLQTRGSHVAITAPDHFGNFSEWRKFVNESAVEFKQLLHFWLEQANIPSILVIKYEDMLTDLATQLRKMLDFLQVPYTDKDIDCAANDKLEHNHRKKVKSFEHYIPADRQLVLHSLMSVERLLNKYHVSYKDVLNDYQN